MLAWRRVSWASARRVFRIPLVVAAVTALGLVLFSDAPQEPWAFALFVFAAFAISGLAQEFWNGATARRKIVGGSLPGALVGVVSRNRRRYGGYIVHVGIAVLLIGIAASSSFQTNRDVTLKPGESTVVDGRTMTYVRPTVAVTTEYLQFGGDIRVEQDGKVTSLHPSRRYFRPTGQEAGSLGNFFEGESTSEVGLRAALGSDLWIAPAPNISGIQERVRAADKGFRACVSRRSRNAAAVRRAGGDDARRRRQSGAAGVRAGPDQQAAIAGDQPDRQELRRRIGTASSSR